MFDRTAQRKCWWLCPLVISVIGVLVIGAAGNVYADQTPELGRVLTQAEVQALDFTVLPNGDGLPVGSGNAVAGRMVYQQHCVACHGVDGKEGLNDRLAGGHGSLDSAQPVKTLGSFWPYATTVFDYVRRAMPYTAPGSLASDEVYALTAYLLHINGVIEEAKVLDAQSLPSIKMPNRDNFELIGY